MRLTAALAALVVLVGGGHRAPRRTAVFAGGCYWGIESVFKHLRGVHSATSGFAVPTDSSAKAAGAANKGFAEAVRIEYDPQLISYDKLLEVFFLVAHDPTQLDRQGPDNGPRYRSIVFVATAEEHETVRRYLDSLRAAGVFQAPIVTEIDALKSFEAAEPDQQDFVARHPMSEYVVLVDRPKLDHLRSAYPDLYRD